MTSAAVQGPTFPGHFYRIQVKKVTDATWQTVNNPFTVGDETGTIHAADARRRVLRVSSPA